MHPYTVYGIETTQCLYASTHSKVLHAPLYRLRYWNPPSFTFLTKHHHMIACTLIPFTVLKLHDFSRSTSQQITRIACTLIPFTVLKHSQNISGKQMILLIACTLIPFTVLKQESQIWLWVKRAALLHAPLYRLRYWNYCTITYSINTRFIACTLIPFTVLKQFISLLIGPPMKNHCMHPYTVYGIETWLFLIHPHPHNSYCMHPYTVYGIETTNSYSNINDRSSYCMHPYTVYGIETTPFSAISEMVNPYIACTLIPFTVLKLG